MRWLQHLPMISGALTSLTVVAALVVLRRVGSATGQPAVAAVVATQLRENADSRRQAEVQHATLWVDDFERQRAHGRELAKIANDQSRLAIEAEAAARSDERDRLVIALEARRIEVAHEAAIRADRREGERIELERERHRAAAENERLRTLAAAGQLGNVSFLGRKKAPMTWENDPMHAASER